ncbi:MAG: hypothetical protein ACYS8W_20240 [Planctomycetota bacterium]|jgi:hypothetical protein
MEFLDWLFNTSGIGGLAVCIIVVTLVSGYGLTVRWISKGHVDKTESQ